ncbi:MAG TPA: molybdopterin oxidoreductase family protein [Dermatophilaceae bacterium]|nr:molybdopterin oxidoreductase family protein [Dermatophilaceae bacterium]
MTASSTGTTTHCPYCSLQCGMRLHRTGRTLTVGAWEEFPTNRGAMCRKGWTSTDLLRHRERITTPLVRDRASGELRQVEWDQALDVVADRLRSAQQRHGPDAVGVFGGGGLTNEKAYALGKLARVALRTRMIDYNGRWCMSSAASAGQRAFGLDRGLPFPLADIEQADVVVLVGSNLAETAPPAARHLDALRERGGRLVVVDPRSTPTSRRADLHLQPVPGTDLALAHGILHVLIARQLVDEAYITERTTGFEDLRGLVAGYWPEAVERTTGVDAADVIRTAELLGGAGSVVILTARGAEQHAQGTDTVLAWINVALALGQPGTAAGGYGCITGQGNGQGGREHGQKADQLPGYRRIDDPAARAAVAAVWEVAPEDIPGPGRSAYEMLRAMGTPGGVRALLVFGSNIVVSAPHAGLVGERLDALDFLCVADLVMSETAARADVVLPVTQWAEETGTMTNLEGRVILRRKAIDPPTGVRSDLAVIAGLAARFDAPGRWSEEPETVFEELRRATAGAPADYSGIDYARVEAEHGVFWPCPQQPDGQHPGTPRLFLDRFATPDGRARFHPVQHRGPAEPVDADYPLHLTTGRVLAQYQSGAQTRRVKELDQASPAPFVQLHPLLAAALGVLDGDPVRVWTRRGSTVVPALLSEDIRRDTIFMPFHWVGANLLTNDALDPISGMPEFKVCAAALAAAAS